MAAAGTLLPFTAAAAEESGTTPATRPFYLLDAGPLRLRDQFLFDLGFLALEPGSAEVLPPGRWQIDLVTSLSNTFAMSDVVEVFLEARPRAELTVDQLRELDSVTPGGGVFFLDAEVFRANLAVRRGLGRRLELELTLPVVSARGGFLDSFIDGFHDSFDFDPEGRNGVPRDVLLAYSRSREGELLLDGGTSYTSLGDVTVGAKFEVLRRPAQRETVALRTLLKLPTGRESSLTSSGSADFGAQALYSRLFRRACLHAGVGAAYLGEHRAMGTNTQAVAGAFVAYERLLRRGLAGTAQLLLAQSPFEQLDLEELERTVFQTTLGLKLAVGERNLLFLAITDSFAAFDNAPDLGLHLGWTRAFG